MTEARYKIVFDGQLMPEMTLETVKDNLARLFKSDPSKIDALFSGSPVALKRDLAETEADKYLAALQQAGARVRKEQELTFDLNLVAHDDGPAQAPANSAKMRCPKCGHEQAKSVECAACGIIIEKYQARQAQTTLDSPTQSPYRTPESSLHPTMSAQIYAGFWYRALALLIDTILSTIAAIILVLPLAFAFGASMAGSPAQQIESISESMGNVFGWIVSWLYFTIFESSRWQATPGKKMLGLRATDLNGNRIGFGRANARYWAKILSAIILCIGYIMAAFTEKKQALHDMIAGTLVLKD